MSERITEREHVTPDRRRGVPFRTLLLDTSTGRL
jgi:hypothetical protein